MVINCTAEKERKSQKTDGMVAAAEKWLGIRDMTSEELQSLLRDSVPYSHAIGIVQEQIGPR